MGAECRNAVSALSSRSRHCRSIVHSAAPFAFATNVFVKGRTGEPPKPGLSAMSRANADKRNLSDVTSARNLELESNAMREET
jgi:hypothetical protein